MKSLTLNDLEILEIISVNMYTATVLCGYKGAREAIIEKLIDNSKAKNITERCSIPGHAGNNYTSMPGISVNKEAIDYIIAIAKHEVRRFNELCTNKG